MSDIGTRNSKKFKCCNHPDRPARLPSHCLCAECFKALDAKMTGLADRFALTPQTKKEEPSHG